MRTALTIAGSDSSGGAGIQADIKTMMANGVFAMSAVTALTAQNTTGVTAILDSTPEFLEAQIDAVFTDIFPDAVKIGMVSASPLIHSIAKKLRQYAPRYVVVDPVMVATSGAKLISDEAVSTLKEELLPIATVITPNIPEAEVLSGLEIRSAEDMLRAAESIYDRYHCAVLCKGGHIFCLQRAGTAGLWENASTIPTHMGPAVRFPARSQPIWPRVLILKRLSRAPRNTSPERSAPCWIWDTAAVR